MGKIVHRRGVSGVGANGVLTEFVQYLVPFSETLTQDITVEKTDDTVIVPCGYTRVRMSGYVEFEDLSAIDQAVQIGLAINGSPDHTQKFVATSSKPAVLGVLTASMTTHVADVAEGDELSLFLIQTAANQTVKSQSMQLEFY